MSIDVNDTGAGTVTPPAVGMCSADQVVLMAPVAAPAQGTGLPAAGPATAIRLRSLVPAGPTGTTTGVVLGATVPTTALRAFAFSGVVPAGHTSSTPGDLPPEDPLS